MKRDISDFCHLYYSATFVPISYYKDNKLETCSFPLTIQNLNFSEVFIEELSHSAKNPCYYITKSLCYFGMVRLASPNEFLLIGPLFSTTITTKMLKEFMRECALPPLKQQDILYFLQSTPLTSFYQFLNILAFLHLTLNERPIEITEHFGITVLSSHPDISMKHSNQIYDAKEDQAFHNTFYFEQQYLDYIKRGETEKLKIFLLHNGPTLKAGSVADNALRQAKNIFISCTTLSTRSAIAGGLDIEQAYHLSDIYINEGEKLQSLDSISTLQYTMIIDFSERVARTKLAPNMSKDVFECVQYINRHTNELIRVNDIATYINRSRSYISKKFKAELGMDLGSYIMHCKLEEAKSLLSYSDKTLSEISNYLCFSSQAYFQNVFKKKYGLTPKQYRNQTI